MTQIHSVHAHCLVPRCSVVAERNPLAGEIKTTPVADGRSSVGVADPPTHPPFLCISSERQRSYSSDSFATDNVAILYYAPPLTTRVAPHKERNVHPLSSSAYICTCHHSTRQCTARARKALLPAFPASFLLCISPQYILYTFKVSST